MTHPVSLSLCPRVPGVGPLPPARQVWPPPTSRGILPACHLRCSRAEPYAGLLLAPPGLACRGAPSPPRPPPGGLARAPPMRPARRCAPRPTDAPRAPPMRPRVVLWDPAQAGASSPEVYYGGLAPLGLPMMAAWGPVAGALTGARGLGETPPPVTPQGRGRAVGLEGPLRAQPESVVQVAGPGLSAPLPPRSRCRGIHSPTLSGASEIRRPVSAPARAGARQGSSRRALAHAPGPSAARCGTEPRRKPVPGDSRSRREERGRA